LSVVKPKLIVTGQLKYKDFSYNKEKITDEVLFVSVVGIYYLKILNFFQKFNLIFLIFLYTNKKIYFNLLKKKQILQKKTNSSG